MLVHVLVVVELFHIDLLAKHFLAEHLVAVEREPVPVELVPERRLQRHRSCLAGGAEG